jgi:hypothetical protein
VSSWTALVRAQAHKSERRLRLATLVATACWYLKRFLAHETLQLRISKNAGIIPELDCRRKQRRSSSTPAACEAPPDADVARAFSGGFQRDHSEKIAKVRSMLEEVSRLLEREATDRRSWRSDLPWLKVTTADFRGRQLIGAILHPVLVHQTERGVRWQG